MTNVVYICLTRIIRPFYIEHFVLTFSHSVIDFQGYFGFIHNTSASYFHLLLSIGRNGKLQTFLYDKRDDFNFHNTSLPFL